MHSKNIMHRDIKPDNLIFSDLQLKNLVIGDFGLATDTEVDEFIHKRCGTPGFVAPEIVNLANKS